MVQWTCCNFLLVSKNCREIPVQDFLSLLSSSWRIALHSPYSDIEVKPHPSSSAQFQREIVQCCWVLLGRFSTTPPLASFSEEGASIPFGDQKRRFMSLFHHLWHQANQFLPYAAQSLSQTTLFLESICCEGQQTFWRVRSLVKGSKFHFIFPLDEGFSFGAAISAFSIYFQFLSYSYYCNSDIYLLCEF